MAVTTTNLGVITAYGDAVAAGYTGTKAEWQALMASYATVGQQAVDAKNAAVAAKDTAVAKATEATTAASTATTKASEASASAQSIAQSAAQIQENTDSIDQLKSDLNDQGNYIISEIEGKEITPTLISNADFSNVGTIVSYTNTLGYIRVIPGGKVHISGAYLWAFFSSKPTIGSLSTDGERHVGTGYEHDITIPNDAYYLVARKDQATLKFKVAESVSEQMAACSSKIAKAPELIRKTRAMNLFANISTINLLDEANALRYHGVFNETSDDITDYVSASDQDYYCLLFNCFPSTEYTISNANYRIVYFDFDGNYINYATAAGADLTITTPSNCWSMGINYKKTVVDVNGMMIVYGDTLPSEYVAYKPTIDSRISLGNDFCYVSPNGSDSNDGKTASTPFLTFQKAITSGAKKIYAERGDYYNQSLVVNESERELTILPYSYDGNNISYDTSNPDRQLINIVNGIQLENLVSDSGLLKQAFSGTERFAKVFVSHTMTPTFTSGSRTFYNIGVWQIDSADKVNNKKLLPVLTLLECQNTEGSVFYDGTDIYIHAFNSTYTEFWAQTDIEYTFRLKNFSKVHFEDVSVMFTYHIPFRIENCMDVFMRNCESRFALYGNGMLFSNSNGNFYGCNAYNCGVDGLGSDGYGCTNFYDCVGSYCADDGISHHYGNRGSIVGGEYAYNGKGGVSSPTYGAIINVDNVYMHHNHYGLYATAENTHPLRKCKVSNCLVTDNDGYGFYIAGNIYITGWNNVFADNAIDVRDPTNAPYKEYKNVT